ncbi:MAG: glycoside hydrolase family 28 protein [Eubacteriales bacterium]|nr:glycoside hydrolase family 28 protein [Eubacteriales bacterium]
MKGKITFLIFVIVLGLSGCAAEESGPVRGGEYAESAEDNKVEAGDVLLTETYEETFSWSRAEAILEAVQEPRFPDYCVDIRDFGAIAGDGILDTDAVRQAIETVHEAGGGMVIVPSGVFDTGSIELKSGVNLCLEQEDSILQFAREITVENYPLVLSYYEGAPCYNWSSLIYAYEQDNIAVTGRGRLDGQADAQTWWNWHGNVGVGQNFSRPSSSDTAVLRRMTEEGVDIRKRIFGEGHYLRPNFIQTIGCRNVLIEGVTVENSPMWGIHPVLCTSVTIRGVTVRGQWNNNDGCSPENSRLVLIEDCVFQTEGDAVALKSGRGRDGWQLGEKGYSARDIVIRNNIFVCGSSGIAFGSEMSGGIRDVYADNNQFGTEGLDYGIRLKANADRGGVVERIYIRDAYMAQIRNAAFYGSVYYGEEEQGGHIPEFRDIRIRHMVGNGGEYGVFLEAYEEKPVRGLELLDVHLENTEHEIWAVNWENPRVEYMTVNGKEYPRPMKVRAKGITASGRTVEGLSEIPGRSEESLSWHWILKQNGDERTVGREKMLTMTDWMAGGLLYLEVSDPYGNTELSMGYRVLSRKEDDACGSDTIRYALSRGYLEHVSDLPRREVTNRDCAVILAKLWNLETGDRTGPILADVQEQDPDYDLIRVVTGHGYMPLKQKNRSQWENLVYQEQREKEIFYFLPDQVITREELGEIALLACGIPYEEMMTLQPAYTDTGEIAPQYRSSVGVSSRFGFVKGRPDGRYMPREAVGWADFLETIQAISEFNSR